MLAVHFARRKGARGACAAIKRDVTEAGNRHPSAKWLIKNSAFAKAEPFLPDASEQPSVARDIDNTFICDANNEVWELN